MVKQADISLLEAVKMISNVPATIMGISDTKGSLTAGKDADVLIFDEKIIIKKTIIKGEIIYTAIDFNK